MESNNVRVKYYAQKVEDLVYNVFKIIEVDKNIVHCLKASRYFDSFNIDITFQGVSDFSRVYQELYLKDTCPITKEVFDTLFIDIKEQLEVFM